MIHRPSRDRLAEALRHYVAGRITNDDLADVEIDWRDRGAIAIYEMSWSLYDDAYEHRAIEKNYIEKAYRRDIARWIAFLYSNEEYIWPEYSFIQIVNFPMNLVTLGWWERMKRRRWEQFLEAGDFSVWPFCSKQELLHITKHPKLLSGRCDT